MADQVSDLKLQHLVELSKLGDGCAELESEIEAWLAGERRRLRRSHDPVRADAALRQPRPGAAGAPRGRVALRRAQPLLRCLPRRRAPAGGAGAAQLRGLAGPGLPRLPLPAPHLPPRRLPRRRPGQVPRVQRRLAGRHRLHRRAARGAAAGRSRCRGSIASSTPPTSRCCRCSIATLLDAYREMRAARAGGPELPETPRLALVDVPGSPSIPEFRIICAAAAEAGIEAIHAHHRRALLRRLGAPRRRRARAARLPPGPGRRPHRGRPDRRLPGRRRLRRQPAARPGRQQQEADGAARRSPLRPPGRAARGGGDRGDDPLDPGPAAGPGHLRAVDDRPARLRLRQPRPAGAEAGLRVRRPRRRAGDGDRAGRLGPDHLRAGRGGRLHRPGVRPRARGDVPDGRGRPRADAPEALQHQPVRDRRALRGDDHPDLRPGGDQRLGRAAGCCRAWSAATSGVCSPSRTGIRLRRRESRDETRA